MSLVDELVDAADRNPGHWIAKVVRGRPGMAWTTLLGHVRDRSNDASRWADDGGREPTPPPAPPGPSDATPGRG